MRNFRRTLCLAPRAEQLFVDLLSIFQQLLHHPRARENDDALIEHPRLHVVLLAQSREPAEHVDPGKSLLVDPERHGSHALSALS